MVQRQLESDGAVNVINMKRRKWLKRERFMNFGDVYSDKVDRISQLPEPIIHHILSLLPTEDAVCTNVLSKTWRRIWSTFPVFDFRNASSVPCEINLVACSKSLRKLSLLSATMTEEEFQNLMSLTPGVEVLELYYLGRCSRIMISSQNLKRLVLKACKKWLVAEIDTPNLLSVEHTCYQRYLSFNYINAAHLREVDLEFCLASHDIGWFSKLKEFLTSFAHSENFSMVVLCSKNVSIHAKLREILLLPLYTLMDLNPQVIISSKTFTELVDRVFDRFHPDTLSLISMCSCRKYLEFLYESLVEQEDHCEDFRSRRNHWRHFLGGFEIENLEGVEENRTSPWKAFLKSYLTVAYWTVALKLEWKCTKMYKSSGVMF
ncbi:uncharacterized protein LOC131318541 isoform X2 [Rhododendron vialii]|uniref:uncharacterized protein LOC131318541 isoform X2 n=1 Tax=Rhododendron vialii TaxID=182163 RepID=UPI00265DB7CB|nr:uncharacterized protein LOC131318541 isoform X2 [Rhododendron vialii]